jgi:hypothetical protein
VIHTAPALRGQHARRLHVNRRGTLTPRP